MVLEQKQTHIAYHCPHCGNAVLGFVGQFALSGDMLKLKCQCGHSEMTVSASGEEKIRLTVPCLFCENPHHYTVTSKLFFGRDIFLLNCPYANMDICFIGQPEQLQKELDRSAAELNELYDQTGASLPASEQEQPPEQTEIPAELLPDEQVYDIVRFLIRELEADGAIDCPCHSGSYDFDIVPGGVKVLCPDCGAEYIFPANSVSAAQEFLNCDSVTLSFPNSEN